MSIRLDYSMIMMCKAALYCLLILSNNIGYADGQTFDPTTALILAGAGYQGQDVGYFNTDSTDGCGNGGQITTAEECNAAFNLVNAQFPDANFRYDLGRFPCDAAFTPLCKIVKAGGTSIVSWDCESVNEVTADETLGAGFVAKIDFLQSDPAVCGNTCKFTLRCGAPEVGGSSLSEVAQPTGDIGDYQMRSIADKATMTVDPGSFDASGFVLVQVSEDAVERLEAATTDQIEALMGKPDSNGACDTESLVGESTIKAFEFTYGYTDDNDAKTAARAIGALVVQVRYGVTDIRNIDDLYDDSTLAICIVLTYKAKGNTDADFINFSKVKYFLDQDITITGDLEFDVGPLTILSSDDKKEQTFDAQTIAQEVTANFCELQDDLVKYQESTESEFFVGNALSICVYSVAEGLKVDDIVTAKCTSTSGDDYPIITASTVVNDLFTTKLDNDFALDATTTIGMKGFKTVITSEYIGSLTCTGDVTLSSTTRRRGLQLSSNEGTSNVASRPLDDENNGKFAINLNIVGREGQGYNGVDSLSLSAAATFSSSAKVVVVLTLAAAVVVVVNLG